ncbi:hypothetical protein IAR55_004746 [Kwoniella newhampshirensis]|uniref:2'-phosphotransferase n=1 Tax=Kwoniella newhampshirensis TaxID=1651941 RepID=A0AAW0YWQ0_9TREE
MPRPPETPDVKASKALAYILRHGAEKESLHIRSDGYIKLADVLSRPKMREVDLEMVLRLVAENAKQRFELFYGYDPSPLRPKTKAGQGKGKAQGKKVKVNPVEKQPRPSGDRTAGDGAAALSKPALQSEKVPDAATIDNIRHELVNTSLDHSSMTHATPTAPPELPLISLAGPSPGTSSAPPDGPKGEYFIRATQGHSIKLESTAHLVEVKDDDEGRQRVGLMVHGTKWELWDALKSEGLSRMTRQHIHLAPSLTGQITPRPTSTLYIYLDLPRLVDAGIPVYTSSNGVVLTPGGEGGVVGKEFWKKAERKHGGKRIVIWEDGREVEREETLDDHSEHEQRAQPQQEAFEAASP